MGDTTANWSIFKRVGLVLAGLAATACVVMSLSSLAAGQYMKAALASLTGALILHLLAHAVGPNG